MPLLVMFACNNSRGNPQGWADALDIEGISLVGGRVVIGYDTTAMPGATKAEGEHTLRIGKLKVPALGYTTWVGNWCWDAANVRAIHALKIINHLAKRKDWHCEEAECAIFEAFNDRRVITPAEWKAWGGGR